MAMKTLDDTWRQKKIKRNTQSKVNKSVQNSKAKAQQFPLKQQKPEDASFNASTLLNSTDLLNIAKIEAEYFDKHQNEKNNLKNDFEETINTETICSTPLSVPIKCLRNDHLTAPINKKHSVNKICEFPLQLEINDGTDFRSSSLENTVKCTNTTKNVNGEESSDQSTADKQFTQLNDSSGNYCVSTENCSISKNNKIQQQNKTITANDRKLTDNFKEQEINSSGVSFSSQQHKLHLSNWDLPPSVLQSYADVGITSLFSWQLECLLLDDVLTGCNLVYSAPTSAGKTLVAELLMLKRILETNKKAIFVLPFVSVAREKMFYLKHLFEDTGIKVGGYIGSHHPPGGWKAVDLAVCTIEKANSLVNRLLEDRKLHELGILVVDELHLLGDPSRGYLLELLLTKVCYMSKRKTKTDNISKVVSIQIIGMSATLSSLSLLATWLDAKLYHTEFRPVPLTEYVKIGDTLYNRDFKQIRQISVLPCLSCDSDNIIQLCLETVMDNHAALVFCPSKLWCENLATSVAREFFKIGKFSLDSKLEASDLGKKLRYCLRSKDILDVLEQLRRIPSGLDAVLAKTISFGVAFHHAGLTIEERDIIEDAFKQGIIKVLVATSTLCSGVNLPARRVIIRSPLFRGEVLDVLTYKQMIGRAGRKGIDCKGESILICKEQERSKVLNLLQAVLPPVQSCLMQKSSRSLSSSLKRAILEIIVNGVADTPEEVTQYCDCTLLGASLRQSESSEVLSGSKHSNDKSANVIEECVKYLEENEFINLMTKNREDGTEEQKYIPTQLGNAILRSAFSPDEGLLVFRELDKARKCFVLENELHVIYQVTPLHITDQWINLDWHQYLILWENLPHDFKHVGNVVGVEERFLVKMARGNKSSLSTRQHRTLAIHQRFYTALVLFDLVNEKPFSEVTSKFNCNRGMLQSLQQSASTFAGMVTTFCSCLGWTSLELLLAQFQKRLNFGIHRELCELVQLPILNGQRARLLFNAGYETIVDLATADPQEIEILFKNSGPFQSDKLQEGESDFELHERQESKCMWLNGKKGVTEAEAAKYLIEEARQFLQKQMHLSINWELPTHTKSRNPTDDAVHKSPLHISSLDGKETSKVLDKTEFTRIVSPTIDKLPFLSISSNTQKEPEVMVTSSAAVDSTMTECALHIPNRNECNIERTLDKKNKSDIFNTIHSDTSSTIENSVLKSSNEQLHFPHKQIVNVNADTDLQAERKIQYSFCTKIKNINPTIESEDIIQTETSLESLEYNIESRSKEIKSLKFEDNIKLMQTKKDVNSKSIPDSPLDFRIHSNDVNNSGNSDPKEIENFNKMQPPTIGINSPDAIVDDTLLINSQLIRLLDCCSQSTAKEDIPLKNSSCKLDLQFSSEQITKKSDDNILVFDSQTSNYNQSDGNICRSEAEINDGKKKSFVSEMINLPSVNTIHTTSISNSGIECLDNSCFPESSELPSKKKELNFQDESVRTKSHESFPGNQISDTVPSSITSSVLQYIINNEDWSSIENTSPLRKSSKYDEKLSEKASVTSSKLTSSLTETKNTSVYLVRKNRKKSEKQIEDTTKCKANKEEKTNKVCIQKKIAKISSQHLNDGSKTKIEKINFKSENNELVVSPSPPKQYISKSIRKNEKVRTNSDTSDCKKESDGFNNHGAKVLQVHQSNIQPVRYSDIEEITLKNCKCNNNTEQMKYLEKKANIKFQKKIKIINVTYNKENFNYFIKEWKSKSKFSVSVACEELNILSLKKTIGSKICKKATENNMNLKKEPEILSVETDMVKVVGIAICWNDCEVFYISLTKENNPEKQSFGIGSELSVLECVEKMKNVLSNATLLKERIMIAYNVKEQIRILSCSTGIFPDASVEDPKVAIWLLDPYNCEKQKFHNICSEYLSEWNCTAQDYCGQFIKGNLGLNPANQGLAYIRGSWEAYISLQAMTKLQAQLQDAKLWTLFKDVEMPSILLISKSELNGFGFDSQKCSSLKLKLEAKLVNLEEQAYTAAGRKFSFLSSKDVAQLLYVTLKLPPGGNTESSRTEIHNLRNGLAKRNCSLPKILNTSKEALKKLEHLHLLPGIILEWRKLSSILSKVLYPLQKKRRLLPALHMNRIFGQYHFFNTTGRISMHEPNLQNIPKDFEIRFPEVIGSSPTMLSDNRRITRCRRSLCLQYPVVGKEMLKHPSNNVEQNNDSAFTVNVRSLFIPFDGGVLLSADYSQLEVRILAHLSKDDNLLTILNSGGDIFKIIAATWKGIKINEVTVLERQQAKQICYGIIYGMGTTTLAEQLNVSENDAKLFMETFHMKYPGIKPYFESVIEKCKELGYVETLLGRRRYLPEIYNSNVKLYKQAERQATNTTIQGSAADIVKKAMARIDYALTKQFPETAKPHQTRQSLTSDMNKHGHIPSGGYFLLHLHDELIFEVRDNDLLTVAQIIKHNMENVISLSVPLPVVIKKGVSWSSLQEMSI